MDVFSSVMDWQPAQGGLHLKPDVRWYWLQFPHNPQWITAVVAESNAYKKSPKTPKIKNNDLINRSRKAYKSVTQKYTIKGLFLEIGPGLTTLQTPPPITSFQIV